MIFHPAIIALFLSSILIGYLLCYSAYFGFVIQKRWDLQSGSELQLNLERKTYLISTILGYVFVFEILSFFLYIFTADRLHTLFVGAMCAAGTLRANAYGYPALLLKVFNLVLAGLWLTLNYADNRGYDYPLIRKKYLFLFFFAPFILLEMYLQAQYFLGLRPNIITSCCGSLFSAGGGTLASDLAAVPATAMKWIFYLTAGSTVLSAIRFYRQGRGGYFFAVMSALTLLVSIVSIISFISLYYYELPTHHCPFCILQGEYHYIGYLLYGTLLGGAVAGMGTGMLMPFRNLQSLAQMIPRTQKKLAFASIVLFSIFMIAVTCRMVFSDFRL